MRFYRLLLRAGVPATCRRVLDTIHGTEVGAVDAPSPDVRRAHDAVDTARCPAWRGLIRRDGLVWTYASPMPAVRQPTWRRSRSAVRPIFDSADMVTSCCVCGVARRTSLRERPVGQEKEMRIDLIEFSVVVVAQSNNPTILNPDFLKHNGIVSAGRDLHREQPPLTTPMFSQVAFEDGLVVRADPATIAFMQAADVLAHGDIDGPTVAKGYLKTVPHVRYTALGLNPKAVIRNPPFARLSKMLRTEGSWMTSGSSTPGFELKVTYPLSGRRLALTLQEAQTKQGDDVLLCTANIHREIEEGNQQMRVSSILSMLDCWENDLDEFNTLVDQALRLNDDNAH